MSLTHKARILAAARGEMVDQWPYVPRIDLWFNANNRAGTLPKEHQGRNLDQICAAEGWATHHLVPHFIRGGKQQLHRGLGLYNLPEQPFTVKFSDNIQIEVINDGDYTTVIYRTPVGEVSTKTMYSEEMKASGASITWVDQHVLKKPEDCEVVAYIFENLILEPNYDEFSNWLQNEVGDGGIGAGFASLGASPMHHIQREFLDATEFYFYYNDHPKQMARLAEGVSNFYEQAFKWMLDSPAEAILWGANFDDMITYSTYFVKEIQPWLRKVGPAFTDKGKVTICHCDGENYGLMDILPESGFSVAEAICPWPMTKVKIEEYYHRWRDRLTVFGGIPSNLLLDDCATNDEFEGYLDNMFKCLHPGDRLIVGIADTTPPMANWDRLRRIGDRIAKEAKLPLAGQTVFVSPEALGATESATPEIKMDNANQFQDIRKMVFDGDDDVISAEVNRLLAAGVAARDIMQNGLVAAMDIISPLFKAGTVFIPEVLLSARAMNQAVVTLEPHLAESGTSNEQKTVVLGTVFGDLHDIGKNMVATMLKGAGFKIIDMGINVAAEDFVKAVAEHKPDVLGLSALLTTTMPEMGKVVDSITEAGLRDKVKIIVGGAPVNEKFARDIKADGYSADAGEAVDLARKLTK